MKFVNSAKFYKADVLILGGDITGKAIIPMVPQQDCTISCDFLGQNYILTTPEDKEAFEKKVRFNGYYPTVITPDEMKKLEEDKKYQFEFFSKVMAEGVKRWVSIAEERLKDQKVKCYISPGNDDRFDIDDALKSSSTVICPEDEVVSIDDHHEMITSGWSNPTPWNSARETSEDKLEEIFNKMISKVRNMQNCLFNLHAPPFGTALDLAPELDEQLTPKLGGSQGVKVVHVGSEAVRRVIERHQPLLGLHGHIHEAKGFAKIGRTVCINPGSEYGEGIMRGAVINLDDKGIKSYILTQG